MSNWQGRWDAIAASAVQPTSAAVDRWRETHPAKLEGRQLDRSLSRRLGHPVIVDPSMPDGTLRFES